MEVVKLSRRLPFAYFVYGLGENLSAHRAALSPLAISTIAFPSCPMRRQAKAKGD